MAWGTTYIVTTHLLPGGHPLFAAMMRSLPAGLIALLIARQLPHGSWWWKSVVLGTLNMAAFFPLLFLAAQQLPGGVAATLGAAQPIVIAFLAVAILHEKLSLWRVTWGVLGMIGVALVVLGPNAAMSPLGILAGLGGAVSMGIGVVLIKKWGAPKGYPQSVWPGGNSPRPVLSCCCRLCSSTAFRPASTARPCWGTPGWG